MPLNTQKCRLGLIAGALLSLALWMHPEQSILSIPVASAADLTGDVTDVIFTITNFALSIATFIAWVCFAFLTILMDPQFIFDLGGGNEFMDVLQSIWQLSRDLMNVIFAIMLVFAALYVIIMNKKDFIQEHIAKFVLAVVFVNFSWFFPRVLLDVSAVLTSTIYGIPSLLSSECVADDEEECLAVTSIIFLPSDDQRFALDSADGWDCERMVGLGCVQLKPLSSSNVSASSTVLNGLVVNHGRLLKLAELPTGNLDDDSFRGKALFAVRSAIILIIMIALVFPLIAMCVAFFMRIPMLWITVAFMPFFFLDLVGGEKISQGYGKKIWENFLSAAFLPALVAIPLSVGYILLNAGDQIAFESLEKVPFRLLDGVGTLHEIMWLFLALAIMWTGVFGVLKKQEIIGKGAERIEGFGKELGKLAINTPLSTPIIPGISGGSILNLMNVANPANLNQSLRSGMQLKDIAERIKNGNNPSANTPLGREVNTGVQKIVSTVDVTNKINASIKALETTDPAALTRARADLIRDLERQGIKANNSNLEEVLRLMKDNRAGIGKLKISDEALKNARTTPTPPATPTPPVPPT